MNETPFKRALKNQIQEYIRKVRTEGTVAMGLENLIQCVRTPSTGLEGAPVGTNASYVYKQLFREVCESSKAIKSFLL